MSFIQLEADKRISFRRLGNREILVFQAKNICMCILNGLCESATENVHQIRAE